jgi:IS605 OrfB family transposase
MKLIKTLKIKLDAEATELLPTITAYTNAFNYICQAGFLNKKSNSIDLHQLTYKETRNRFNLPSQLACSARNKACEALNALRKKKKNYILCPKSKQQSIRYDKRSYSLFLDKLQVSLLTCSGRKKFNLNISKYHQEYFASWKYTSADLCISRSKVYLHIVFERDIQDVPTNGTFVGLDRGISNLAVVSNNKFYTGKHVKRVSLQYRSLRRRLQKRGTKSAKRHLIKLSGKEKRFKADINHQISKKIINSLNPGDTLAIEDLSGIRAKKLRKSARMLINSWSFYQLEQFLQYKANAKGVCIIKVSAKYTSQTCSKCGYCARNNRKTRALFECKSCGFKLNADLNASRNICNKAFAGYTPANGAVVNQPIVSGSICRV